MRTFGKLQIYDKWLPYNKLFVKRICLAHKFLQTGKIEIMLWSFLSIGLTHCMGCLKWFHQSANT